MDASGIYIIGVIAILMVLVRISEVNGLGTRMVWGSVIPLIMVGMMIFWRHEHDGSYGTVQLCVVIGLLALAAFLYIFGDKLKTEERHTKSNALRKLRQASDGVRQITTTLLGVVETMSVETLSPLTLPPHPALPRFARCFLC